VGVGAHLLVEPVADLALERAQVHCWVMPSASFFSY